MRARPVQIAVVAVVLAMSACKKAAPPPPAPVGPSAEEIARARQDSVSAANAARDRAAAAQAERDRAAQAERDRTTAAQRELSTALEAMIRFDYDESDLNAEAERLLRDKVDILRANGDVRIRVEGHADERGSTEYNLALASRRAEAVKQFFTGFGLDAGRFETVSYGEERALVNRSDEDAWAQNRRAEFVITGGGATLTSPR
ncbi:MAG: peptidoglycan-associated lipoprotein [Gemmatimonadetes bacterium]|nr:peptidoglycan-associated lipoprotein [Gemmatimonadota bacterium]